MLVLLVVHIRLHPTVLGCAADVAAEHLRQQTASLYRTAQVFVVQELFAGPAEITTK
jgi:hypothetical protein